MQILKCPKISIITPSLNQVNFLEQTITSVLSQNYPNLEYIIIDGGSTDQSVEIIKKYKKHLAYWVSKPDRGQSDAINKGLRKATGEVINWINSDDYYEKGALTAIADAFRDKEVNAVCGKGKIVRQDGELVRYSRGTDVYNDNLAKTIGWARIDQPETFFRRQVLKKTGLLNPNLHYVMDKAWWINYLLIFGLDGVRKFDDILVNFRLHEASKTVSQSKHFAQETDGLFLQLAEQNNCWKEAEGLRHLVAKGTFVDWKAAKSQCDSMTVKQSLHYYLLHRADEFYYQHRRKEAKVCLSSIDPALLRPADLTLYNKLKVRCRWLPVPLVKLVRT